jgi:hypothetical protein
MVQNSIVVIIIAATVGYVAYGMIKSLTVKTKKSGCGGCSGCDLAKHSKGCNS